MRTSTRYNWVFLMQVSVGPNQDLFILSFLFTTAHGFVLAGNELASLPRQLRCLSSTLTELDLSFNSLTALHVDLVLLKCLRVLNLSNNNLLYFPSGSRFRVSETIRVSKMEIFIIILFWYQIMITIQAEANLFR